VGRCLASLDCHYAEAIDLWSARLGNGMAAAQPWTTLGLQKIRRVFRAVIDPRPLSSSAGSRESTGGLHAGDIGSNPIQTFRVQMLRGAVVCKMTDNTFSKLRITRAYIKLLCIPEGDARTVSLVQIGNYEIRMLEAPKADTDDGPLFLIELFDLDAQSSVDSCICDEIEEGVAAFEDFISR
jgi:hypothetical protein